jgi:flagellar motor protein MotB
MENLIDTHHEDSEINFWPVYSDLAIVVVIIMLLFLMAQFVVNIKLVGEESLEVINNQNKLRQNLIVDIKDDGTPIFYKGISNIQKDGNLQLITFSSDIIFGLNQSNWRQLSVEGRALLSSCGKEIAKNQEMITRIQIEGHASWERSHRFSRESNYNHYNWEISSRRALTVAEEFIKQGVEPAKISCASRAHYVPANQTIKSYKAAARQAKVNRRINVIFFYSQHGVDSPILR